MNTTAPVDTAERRPAAVPPRPPRPHTVHTLAPAPRLQVTLLGELLHPAELRVANKDGATIVRFMLAQPGALLPVCADYHPPGGPAAHIAWRTMVHDYRRGTPVRIIGRGLRSSARRAQKVLLLDSTDSVQLLTPPFDGRAAAAGSDDA